MSVVRPRPMPRATTRGAPGRFSRGDVLLWAALLAAAIAAALLAGWTGFIASDDALYYDGAIRWLDDPPFAGDTHWSTRFPVTLTLAGAVAVVGRGYAAFATTALLFYALLIVTVGLVAGRIASVRAGWIAALLAATLPVVVSQATTVSCDLIEASALLIGATLLGGARDDRAGLVRGVFAGLAFGIALLCRETSVLPLAGLAPLFLIGRPVPRRVLLAAGAGFALVVAGEAVFQYALTGDPWRRYAIAFHHDAHIDRARNLEGNWLVWPPIDPLLVLLVNDDFGLLFWIAGAAVVAGATRGLGAAGGRRLIVLGVMATASFLLVAVLADKLVLNPRYFMLPALVATIVVAIGLDRARAATRWTALAALVASGLLLISVGNRHPRWEMEVLVAAARAHPGEIVAGEPGMVRRAALAMQFAGLANLRAGPAAPGGLVVARADAARTGRIVAHYPSPPTRLGAVLRALGVEPLVPASLAPRLLAPGPAFVVVRAPAGGRGGG